MNASPRARQRRTLVALAILLIAGGAAVLLFVQRMPLPLRILIGFGDIVAGCGLLVLVRQKFR